MPGSRPGQNLIVSYTDGTAAVFTQTFSDWDFPGAGDAREIEAVAMRYRTIGNGTLDANYIQNLYAYRFPVDESKTLESLTLPQNHNLILHAITLTGPSASPDAGLEDDAGTAVTATLRGCGCAGGRASGAGDASFLGLALVVAAVLRRRPRGSSVAPAPVPSRKGAPLRRQ